VAVARSIAFIASNAMLERDSSIFQGGESVCKLFDLDTNRDSDSNPR